MAKAVGIDIGSQACKVVVVDGGPKSAKLARFAVEEYDLDDTLILTPEVILAALKKALARAKAPKNAASLALPAEQCIVRAISVPFTKDEQIEKTAKFEFEPHLHSASIEDVVIDYVKTGAARTGTRLLVFACTKPVLAARLEQLTQVGVDPLHVDVDVAALFNVAAAGGALDAHPNCVIIDIGARTTKALFIHDAQLRGARSIRIGTNAVTQRVTNALEGDADAAERALEAGGGVEALAMAPDGEPETMDIMRSVEDVEAAVAGLRQSGFIDRMLRETQRSMPMSTIDTAPTCVYLTGGGSRRAHARERIAEHFDADVEDLPVLTAVSHDLPPSEAETLTTSGAVALGTALKVLGMDAGAVDLRREEFRFSRTFDRVKTALATGVTLVCFALFLLVLIQVVALKKHERDRDRLAQLIAEQLDEDVFARYEEAVSSPRDAKVSDDPNRYFQGVQARLKKLRGHLKNELGLSTEVPPIRSSLQVWGIVMESVQNVRGKIDFLAIKSEEYRQESAKIEVVFGSLPDVDVLVKELRKHIDEENPELGVFSRVEGGAAKATKDEDEKYTVWIEMDVNPLEPGDDIVSGETADAAGGAR